MIYSSKFYFKLTIIPMVLFFCVSCNKKVASKYKEVVKPVYLYYEQTTDTLLKSVLIDETNGEFNNQFSMLKTKSDKVDLNFQLNLNAPQLFRFYSLEPMSAPYIVYITPGDSLNYQFDDNTITFKGTNASHYNFFKELNALNLKYPNYNEEEGISDFKKKRKIDYQKRLDFLEKYVKSNNASNSFHQKIKDVIKFQYINGILNTKMLPKGAITDYKEYLKDIDVEIFKRDDQNDNVYFQLALTNYIRVITEIEFGDYVYSKEGLNFQLNSIEVNFNAITKEYAFTKVLSEFDKHLEIKNIDFLQEKVDIYLPQIENKKYKAVIQKVKSRLNTVNNQLAKKVYLDTLIDLKGNSKSFKEVLQGQGNKIKIIDFWASWCAPCIKDIKNSHQYRKQLIEESNTEFIYISIDEDREKWKLKVKELKEYGLYKNQYVIPDTHNSALRTYFNVSSIPHYAILDGENNVFLMNAPSPDNTEHFNEVIKKIKAIKN